MISYHRCFIGVFLAVFCQATIVGSEHCWRLTQDVLYWKSHEGRLQYATEPLDTDLTDNFAEAPLIKSRDHWSFGLRENIEFCSSTCDSFELSWTYFSNTVHESLIVDITNGIFPVWSLSDELISGDFVYNAEKKWRTHVNIIDAKYCKCSKICQFLRLSYLAGVKGAFINQNFDLGYARAVFPGGIDYVKNRNNFSGVGPSLGIYPEVFFDEFLSIYSSLNASALFGQFDVRQTETYLEGLRFEGSDHPWAVRWVFDFAIGLKYRLYLCNDRYLLSFALGWEFHDFFNQNQLVENEFHLPHGSNDLQLSGGVFSVQFGF